MQISERLRAVAGMVSPGCRLADVGTDHAYIPIYLMQNGTVPQAIAMDINQGPLLRATENIRRYGLSGQVETRLSDGLEKLQAGEADTILIAGMGGLLIVRILEHGRAVIPGCRELVLQPQSDIRSVRAYLEENGWQIDREDLVFEDGKYYPMMRAIRAKSFFHCDACLAESMLQTHTDEKGEQEKKTATECLDEKEARERKPEMIRLNAEADSRNDSNEGIRHELELRYGPLLLKNHHPHLPDYLSREERICRQVLEAMQGKETGAANARREELREELELLHRAKELAIR